MKGVTVEPGGTAEVRVGLLKSYQERSHVAITPKLTKTLVPPDQTFSHTSSCSISTANTVLTRRGKVPHWVSLSWGRALGEGGEEKHQGACQETYRPGQVTSVRSGPLFTQETSVP